MTTVSENVINRKSRTVCLPIEKEEYISIVEDSVPFRNYLKEMIEKHKELFPEGIEEGYLMKDIRSSKKLGLKIRRIKLKAVKMSVSIRPSFVFPYMSAMTEDVEAALFLRKFAVPFWAIARNHGKDKMYWYRLFTHLGNFNIVGSTMRKLEIPTNLSVDEKHSKCCGEKAYVPIIVAEDCVLGISVSPTADEQGLTSAYRDFQQEAMEVNSSYKPQTVNIDGWQATHNAFKTLFSTISIIFCFLHPYIKLRKCSKKKHSDLFRQVADKLWSAYRAKNRSSFSQQIRRLHEWVQQNAKPEFFSQRMQKLRDNLSSYASAYSCSQSHRTSNAVDRVMKRLDRYLFNMQYFHGNIFTSSHLHIRAWGLCYNFWPFCPDTAKKHNATSQAHRLNQFQYHHCWLQNLLISSSLQGYR